jgi:hypothetical protein
MADSMQSSVSDAANAAQRRVSDVADAVSDTARRSAAAVGESAANVRDAANAVGAQAADVAERARRSGGAMVGAMRDSATSAASQAASLGDALTDTGRRTRRQATEAMRQSRESATSFVTEQPLIAAAIGVAVGAAIATLLPGTDAEDSLMGEASDAAKARASGLGSDALEKTRTVAGKVADRAQAAVSEAVREDGLSTATFANAADRLGESVRADAKTAVKDLAGATQSQQGGAGRPSFGKMASSKALETDALKQTMTGTGPQEFSDFRDDD